MTCLFPSGSDSALTLLPNLRDLDAAAAVVVGYRQVGLAYIILTKETGLALYQSVPSRFCHRFIDLFRQVPKTFTGIAGPSAINRIIKTLDRFGIGQQRFD